MTQPRNTTEALGDWYDDAKDSCDCTFSGAEHDAAILDIAAAALVDASEAIAECGKRIGYLDVNGMTADPEEMMDMIELSSGAARYLGAAIREEVARRAARRVAA